MIDHMREQKFGDLPNVEAYENLKSIANLSIARITTATADGTHDAALFGRVNDVLAGAIESVGRLAAAVRKARASSSPERSTRPARVTKRMAAGSKASHS